MPIYLYECTECHQRVEVMQGMGEPTPKCPAGCLTIGEMEERVGMRLEGHAAPRGTMEKVINFRGRINGNCATKNS